MTTFRQWKTAQNFILKCSAIFALFTLVILFTKCVPKEKKIVESTNPNNWPEYLGGPDRNHYASLTQITKENVDQLKIAWTYATPDSGQIQTNPLIIDGVLYGVTPAVQAFALDASTGKQLWIFGDTLRHWASTSRGVSFWKEGKDQRILYTAGPNLWALNADDGKPIESFGDKGKVDLHLGLPEIAQAKFMVSNTPGTIFEDLIIMPVRVSEDVDAAPGDVRAFNVKTGKLEWTFHTIPHPGEFGYETFPEDAYENKQTGAANNWAGMAVDKQRGIVYVPTGSAAYDFYGGNREGQNLFSDCLLALDARTGERIWHFQTTHHDIWDRDLPAPPNLLTLNRNGKRVDVVVQTTKQGYVYVFDRETGEPFFPIKEVSVPSSTLEGETTWKTQPIPTKPKPFARQSNTLTKDDISPYAENREELIQEFEQYETEVYAPGSLQGAVLLPGYDGGAEWGGAAADPEGTLFVNANNMAWIHQMMENPKQESLADLSTGERLFKSLCMSCHTMGQEAVSNIPALGDLHLKRDKAFVTNIIQNGKGMMPGFPMLSNTEIQSIIAFLYGEEKQEVSATAISEKVWLPYKSTGYNKFLDSNGLPAIGPPWGTLSAIDLNSGEYLWQINLGHEPRLLEKGVHNTGVENYGGPIITASGLLFIAATKDGFFRAFDKSTGELLWETQLPYPAFATPSTYQVDGKQYIVLACGGTKLGTPKGNLYVAFALPDNIGK